MDVLVVIAVPTYCRCNVKSIVNQPNCWSPVPIHRIVTANSKVEDTLIIIAKTEKQKIKGDNVLLSQEIQRRDLLVLIRGKF